MAASAPGYSGRRPDEPQCYNCGTSGHWAIACPEPTRETPAGLAAWRNASHSGQGNARDHPGGPKRSKGPIITKYTPHPAPPPPPPPGYGPPPPYGQQNTGHYQAGKPSFPQQPGYPPYSSASPGYQPPPYPAPGYQQPPYPPHPPPHPHPSYSNPPLPPIPPPLPPPSNPYRAPFHPPSQPPPPGPTASYPANYGPQPPYGSTYHQPYTYGSHPQPYLPPYPPHNPAPSYGPPPGLPPGPPPGPSGAAPPRPPLGPPHPPKYNPPSTSSSLLRPGNSVPSSLPPKPPQSRREGPDPQRQHRNKRKHDRHNRHRDNKQKKNVLSSRPHDQKDHDNGRRPKSKSGNIPKQEPSPNIEDRKSEDQETRPKQSPGPPEVQVEGTKTPDLKNTPPPASPSTSTVGSARKVDEDCDWDWEAKAIFQEPEKSPHPPDEVGKPLPSHYTEDVLFPRKWDSVCIESDLVKPDNLEEFIKPAHETDWWPSIEFDPAFVLDGKLPCGEAVPKVLPVALQEVSPEKSGTPESREVNERRRKLDEVSDEEDQARGYKRRRSNSNPESRRRTSRDVEQPRNLRNSAVSTERVLGVSEELTSQVMDRSEAELQRCWAMKRERGRDRSRSVETSSRRSSVSNASSGLDSLEAELLGRDVKGKPSEDTSNRQPTKTESTSKPKRRQTKLDSAYSRRW